MHTFADILKLRWIFLLVLLSPPSSYAVDEAYFENKVRPLLATHCLDCHGQKKQESDLRLDNRNSILQGGSSGEPAALSGKADASLLLQYVRHEVEGMEMPPDKDRLSSTDIEILEMWINGGLPWPEEKRPTVLTMDQRLQTHRDAHWAFQQPVVRTIDLPTAWQHWPRTGVDRYVLRKLLDNDMTPASPASPRALLRRLKFDLVGLPPTMEEVANADLTTSLETDDRQHVEDWVDRYLASPKHGEHWARHWLDVARYADTRGYAFARDRNYPWAYTYRDYVIRALNQDLPFDQFVTEQLAADLLPQESDNRSLAALGFLTVGRKFNNTQDDLDDKIDAVTRGFLGLTVACARCHDHKYDAIPTEDYYSLYGVFDSSQEVGDLPLIGDVQVLEAAREYDRKFAEVNGELQAFEKQTENTIRTDAHSRITEYLVAAVLEQDAQHQDRELREPLVRAWRSFLKRRAKVDEPVLMPWARLRKIDQNQFSREAIKLADELKGEQHGFLNSHVRQAFAEKPPQDKLEMARLYGEVLSQAYKTWQDAGGNRAAQRKQPTEIRQLLLYFSDNNFPATINRDRVLNYSTQAERKQRTKLEAAVKQVKKTQPEVYERAMVVRDKPTPTTAYVFVRGQAGRRGPQVPRRAPVLLSTSSQDRRVFEQGSGRLELARMIASEDNPLTARVFVNRVWMHYFGRPLVATPSDFGIRSDPPLHRGLLDYLATEFMRHNWSIKWLHREIVLSATYQQSSEDRPELFARDPENALLWRMNRKRLGFEATRDAMLSVAGQLDPTMHGKSEKMFRNLSASRRRSIYGYIDRQDLPNLLRVYDFASPDQSAAKRTKTIVPQQALFLLNSQFVQDLAKQIAVDDAWNGLTTEEIAELAYQRVLLRTPNDEEKKVAELLLSEFKNPVESRARLIHVLLLTNEFIYVD